MSIHSSFSLFLVILVGYLSLSDGSYAAAEIPNPAPIEPPPLNSFVSYDVKSISFPAALSSLARCVEHGQAAKDEAALKQFKKCIAAGKQLLSTTGRGFHDEIFTLLGMSYENLDNSKKALESYTKSLELHADNPFALYRSAHLKRVAANCEEAIPLFNEVRWRSSYHQHEVLFELANCFIAAKKAEQATLLLETAYKLNPFYTPVTALLLDTRMLMIKRALDPETKARIERETLTFLRLINTNNPGDQNAAKLYAQLLTKLSDPLLDAASLQQAETIAQQLSEGSAYKDAESVRLLFDSQLKRKNFNGAKATLDRGLAELPQSKVLLEAARQLEIEQTLETRDLEETS